MSGDSYKAAGVDYDVLDAAKRRAVEAARSTLGHPLGRGASVVVESMGEPASLVELGGLRLAVVLECLGTKSMIARAVEDELGLDRWDAVGVDTVAAIVNDLCCVGALPVALNAYIATGSAGWYSGSRHASLVAGWQSACEEAGAAWVGGESPTLAGLIAPDQADLAGSAVGRVPDDCEPWLGSRLAPGDDVVVVASNGLHANGASLARTVASRLPARWAEPLPNGRAFGDAVLDPSALYARFVGAALAAGSPVHYATHITGHGWRKLMRADRDLTYQVHTLPQVPAVLEFLAERAGLSPGEAYGTLNMGAGFVVFAASGAGDDLVGLAATCGYGALVAGKVEAGSRRVVLEPLGVVYESGELELR